MSFDYNAVKQKQVESGGQWTSYSDLFMVLSFVFLLLYVVSSIRSGTFGIQKTIEYQKISSEVIDLRQQIKAYNTLKSDYLKKDADESEVKLYEDLMSKLTLLQEDAREEKRELEKQAQQNEEKAQALNKYQQLVRNIINTNLLAKKRIKRRDNLIETKNTVIKEKDGTIVTLDSNLKIKEKEIEEQEKMLALQEKTINQKKETVSKLENDLENKRKIIESNSLKITSLNSDLDEKIKELKKTYHSANKSKQELNLKIASLKIKNAKKIKELNQKKGEVESQLTNLNSKLSEASSELDNAKTKLEDLKNKEKGYQEKLANAQKEHQKYLDSISKLKGEKSDISKDLKKYKGLLEAKKNLASDISKNLKKHGIKAIVDGKSGDVTLNFGKEYFDTGRSDLKPNMEKILKKFVPIYSKSLFKDQKVAKKIKSVEIIGFSSPTYKGKLVDPKSLDPKDRSAINYNLDLSYYRAKSIFKHIFDKNKMQYQYQKDLLSKVKVTGRSFLSEDVKGRNLASGISRNEYCKKHNCKQSQKVLIKFNLND